uniref:Uncharacterized protein n=1 Tax=Sicyonia whispovirus TaxID=2984283 RepID=A0A9C7EZ39_9VIRU|nr:MAG: hypothetical protein [Sicyonia whispovirus]
MLSVTFYKKGSNPCGQTSDPSIISHMPMPSSSSELGLAMMRCAAVVTFMDFPEGRLELVKDNSVSFAPPKKIIAKKSAAKKSAAKKSTAKKSAADCSSADLSTAGATFMDFAEGHLESVMDNCVSFAPLKEIVTKKSAACCSSTDSSAADWSYADLSAANGNTANGNTANLSSADLNSAEKNSI